MSWWHKEPGHQQAWYWPSLCEIFVAHVVERFRCQDQCIKCTKSHIYSNKNLLEEMSERKNAVTLLRVLSLYLKRSSMNLSTSGGQMLCTVRSCDMATGMVWDKTAKYMYIGINRLLQSYFGMKSKTKSYLTWFSSFYLQMAWQRYIQSHIQA